MTIFVGYGELGNKAWGAGGGHSSPSQVVGEQATVTNLSQQLALKPGRAAEWGGQLLFVRVYLAVTLL